MSSNEVVGHIHKLVQVVYLCNFTLSFFFFLYCSESWVFFLGTGGEHSYYFEVPEPWDKGRVNGVQGEGFGGREF